MSYNNYYKTKKIIYMDSGILSVVYPSPCYEDTINHLADYVVPTGKKYKIVDASVIPTDVTFRDAWEIAEAELTDGVGQ